MPFANAVRRFSRSNSQRNSQQSDREETQRYSDGVLQDQNLQQGQGHHDTGLNGNATYPGSAKGQSAHNAGMPGGEHGNARPLSQGTNESFEYMNRPISHQGQSNMVPSNSVNGLSRTDQVVLRYFWEDKYADNAKRDLHFLKFPHFPQYPSHRDLLPYCEIYHLVKTSPGASIISLGSANGVYIGFELSQGAQLHIDMDDEWRDISHHRVLFKSYDAVLADPQSSATFKSWPKPLTIEFLEEQYLRWTQDLTSFCWMDESVRELGGNGMPQGQGGAPVNSESNNAIYESGENHNVTGKNNAAH